MTESARVIFSGRQTDGKMDSRAGFRGYAQCTVPNTNSTMEPRTEDCIVILPTGNRTGSVKMMSISTGKLITRDQFKILLMPSSVIMRLNEMAAAEGKKSSRRTKLVYDVEGGLRKAGDPTYIRPAQDLTANPDPIVAANPYTRLDLANGEREEYQFDPAMVNDIMGYPEDFDEPTPVVHSDFNMKDLDVGEPETVEYHYPDASVPCTPPDVTVEQVNPSDTQDYGSPNANVGTDLSDAYGDHDVALYAYRGSHIGGASEERVMNITVKEALKSRGAEAKRVIKKKLKQMLDKKVWTPVIASRLSGMERKCIIQSQMFLKEKYLPTGKFEKLKARLVAGGNQQNKDLYDDISSPTVSTSAVMTVFTIAAHEKRKGTVMDIDSAQLME